MYAEQNITKFPVLIPDGEANPYNYKVGKDSIITYVRNLYNSLNRAPTASSFESNGEFDMNGYILQQIHNEGADDDIDDTENFKNNVHNHFAEMAKRRSIMGQHASTMSNPEVHEYNAQVASRSEKFNFGQPGNMGADTPTTAVDVIKQTKAAGRSDDNIDNDLLEKFYSNMESTIM